VAEAMQDALQREVELGRASPSGLPEYTPLARGTRQRLAALIGADADEMAFTDSTTYGINIAVWGHRWRHDDEVLTSTVEHRGILVPLHSLSRRTGVSLRTVAPEALPYAITDHTRMVAISHVSFSTGARLPIGDVAQAARDTGALVLVDGAQAVGALPVDVHALDVDFYAFPGQKWLCGPEGMGGLYVRPGIELDPTFVGLHSLRSSGPGGRDPANVTLSETATRFELGAIFRPAMYGFHAGLRWLADDIGLSTIYERTRNLAAYCHAALTALPHVEVLTPPDAMAGLVCFRVPGDGWVSRLEERGVTVRWIPETRCLRASCAFFNTSDEVDRLVEALREGA